VDFQSLFDKPAQP
jgi:hypothetical protein